MSSRSESALADEQGISWKNESLFHELMAK